MSKATLAQRLTYDGIRTINEIVETLSFEDAHHSIRLLRKHLDDRAEQTAPEDKFDDLLGI